MLLLSTSELENQLVCVRRSATHQHGEYLCGAEEVSSGYQDVPHGSRPDTGYAQGSAVSLLIVHAVNLPACIVCLDYGMYNIL